ncbi:MAG: hypothetical protein AB1403_14130 [Candidatus Riflebacteria bacterium]
MTISEQVAILYDKQFSNVPTNLQEHVSKSVGNIDQLFELYENSSEARLLANSLEFRLSDNERFLKEVMRLVIRHVADSLFHRFNFCKACDENIPDPDRRAIFRQNIKQNLLDSTQNISDISIPLEILESLYSLIASNKINETENLLSSLGINVKKHYTSFLWPIYEQRIDKIAKITKENIWTIGLLYDLVNEHHRKLSIFNGVENGKLNSRFSILIGAYKKFANYDLLQEPQFEKYGLIEISNGRIINENAPRIIDTKHGISVGIKYINEVQFVLLKNLLKNSEMKLSLYPDCNEIKGFLDYSMPLQEAFQYGIVPLLEDIRKQCKKTNAKFIDYQTQDLFFVKTNTNEVTLEEISNDFLTLGESIITRVIHAMFGDDSQGFYFHHLDFEYIFYSLDEFQKRVSPGGHDVKGSLYKRQKIFKIDSTRISPNDVLYPIVLASFKNKELVTEYFQMIGQI